MPSLYSYSKTYFVLNSTRDLMGLNIKYFLKTTALLKHCILRTMLYTFLKAFKQQVF